MRYKLLFLISLLSILAFSLTSVHAVAISACGTTTISTSGVHTVTQNIAQTGSGNCIIVDATGLDVILDCQGFTITTTTDVPIRQTRAGSLEINNCVIESSSNQPAINQIFSSIVRVSNSTIRSTSTGASSAITATSDTNNHMSFYNSTLSTGNLWIQVLGNPTGGVQFDIKEDVIFKSLNGDSSIKYVTEFNNTISSISSHGLTNLINPTFNNAFVSGSALLGFRTTPAEITFNNLNVSTHSPIYAANDVTFVDCTIATDPKCQILSDVGGTFIFNVTHFTTFSSNESAPINVTDDPPDITLFTPSNDSTLFDRTSASLNFDFKVTDDLDATLGCSFYVNEVLISTNSSTLNDTVTTFNKVFTSVDNGNYFWNITCTDSSFQTTMKSRAITVNIIDDTFGSSIVGPISNLSAWDSGDVQGGNQTITTGDPIDFFASYINMRTGLQKQHNYKNVCFGPTETTSTTFYTSVTWIFRFIIIYIIIYLFYIIGISLYQSGRQLK